MALFCTALKWDSISHLRCPSFLVWDFACLSLEMSIEWFFFPFLFSGYFFFLLTGVVRIVSGRSNQSLSELCYVVLKSLYRCIKTVFNACKSSSWHMQAVPVISGILHTLHALCIVISFLILWSMCFSSSLVHFKNGPEYLTRQTAQVSIHIVIFIILLHASFSHQR